MVIVFFFFVKLENLFINFKRFSKAKNNLKHAYLMRGFKKSPTLVLNVSFVDLRLISFQEFKVRNIF